MRSSMCRTEIENKSKSEKKYVASAFFFFFFQNEIGKKVVILNGDQNVYAMPFRVIVIFLELSSVLFKYDQKK